MRRTASFRSYQRASGEPGYTKMVGTHDAAQNVARLAVQEAAQQRAPAQEPMVQVDVNQDLEVNEQIRRGGVEVSASSSSATEESELEDEPAPRAADQQHQLRDDDINHHPDHDQMMDGYDGGDEHGAEHGAGDESDHDDDEKKDEHGDHFSRWSSEKRYEGATNASID